MAPFLIVVKLFLFFVLLLMTVILGFSALNATSILWNFSHTFFLVVVPLLLIVLVLHALRGGSNREINIFLAIVFSGVGIYAAEFILQILPPTLFLPRSFDRRTKLEVVSDLRKEGIESFPSIHPMHLLEDPPIIDGVPLIPVSGMPRTKTVLCNELGEYYIPDTDRFGFVNPDSVWDSPKFQMALIGDSFTNGLCAPDARNYSEILRSRYSPLINVSQNGNGPLVEYASLREYVEPLKPKIVLWIYFEGNDPQDLSREMNNQILLSYVRDLNFTQNLRKRAEEIRHVYRDYLERELAKEKDGSLSARWKRLRKSFPEEFKLWATLWDLRSMVGLINLKREWVLYRFNANQTERGVKETFRKIISDAKRRIEAWGGRMYFVYLPGYRNFTHFVPHPWRFWILATIRSENIPIIDIYESFKNYPDPLSLFPFRSEGHYSYEGHKFVADEIAKFLSTDVQGLQRNER